MLFLFVALLAVGYLPAQQAKTPPQPPKPEVPVISGDLGECSAAIRVTDSRQKPVSNAKVAIEIRYGFAGFRRTTLEIYTNSDGRALVKGLPENPRTPLTFEVSYQGRTTALVVDTERRCQGEYTSVLPDRPRPVEKESEPEESSDSE
ncbi:MAG TPA: hypothetical protein VN577_21350 [Terriglobales bacterium]|nr:hypothetical protein [Terriglobales bacterium]